MRSPLPRGRGAYPARAARALPAALLLAAGCAAPADRSVALADSAGITADSAERTDPAYRAATAALAARRPWLADSLLAPALADSARRTPWVVLLAAEAAAASGRWERVDTLLADVQPASDARAATAARLLLARASLERGDAAAALAHARQARELATLPRSRGEALALLARARERLGMRDGARTAYDSAAAMLPPVGDWLALRAAALTPGRAERSRAYDRLHLPAARERAAYVEAQILEHTGRPRDAIPLYESVGASHHAMRLRAATARGTTERTRARRELVAFIRARAGSPSARQAIEMLDEGRYALSAEEELIVARSAAVHGPLSRARAGLARAFRQRPPTDAERLFQASVLARSGASGRREAARVLARIAASSPYAGRAALERALLLRAGGRREAARGALRAIVRRYPRDTTAAAGALLALAEMATDAKRDAEARDSYLAVARRYPTSAHAPAARFQAAILAFAAGRHAIAAAELDSLVALYPLAREVTPARYWSGRARAARGDSDSARERWGMLLAADSTSYYAALAARRLGAAPWVPPEHPDRFAALPDVEDALARVELLERLGMGLEARLEMESLAASADSSAERLLAVANAFRARGQTRRAMELGRRVIALGAADARAWRLVYPVDAADLVASQAAAREVDPALVAAVIRQESSFDRWATSEAGARGLMQVMPRVAQALARAERIAPWSAARLYEPEVNVRLGVLHLRSFTGHYGHPALALAAYNAGPGRVARWSSRAGGKDPELFVERIRFAETRGYVQTVLWSRDLYAALYDWSPARAAD